MDSGNTMLSFFNQLKSLQNYPDSLQIVSIVHIGDSHIQADFQTNVTRMLFQQYFGSAGRGLIVPLKLAKTNEPSNYDIFSPQQWTNVKFLRKSEVPIGIGGLALTCLDSFANISIKTYNSEDWAFNRVSVFCRNDKMLINPVDSLHILSKKIVDECACEFLSDTLMNCFTFNLHSDKTDKILFYGVNLENGKSGIVYHGIGINGARYSNYTNIPLFYEQLPLLRASLIIVSLGTNEAYDPGLNASEFYQTIDKTVNQIHQSCPEATILLTTPVESWLRYNSKRRMPNSRIKLVSNTIVQYATDNNLACWDLYSITGGKNSAYDWQKNGLFAKDGIHLNKKGYGYIGELLFQAIYNTYYSNNS